VNSNDTIAAIASAAGGGCRGIVRLSGEDCLNCLMPVFQADDGRDPLTVPRAMRLSGRFELPRPLGPVPCELYAWPDQRSYTRQPVAEVHTWGSVPILDAILAAVCRHGARPARPGEFTMRAFLAGRLDLTQAEAVLGVIDAQDRRDFQAALGQLAGGLGQAFQDLRERLLDLLAEVEAGLDFVDEDISFLSNTAVEDALTAAQAELRRIADQFRTRGEASVQYRVTVTGWPNVGKSSLLNALAGSPTAIVSDVAGTTRDYITCERDIQGLNCLLIDTAGVEDADGQVARAAQDQSAAQQLRAHLQLLCLDATRPLNGWELATLRGPESVPRILVLTKTDQPRRTDLQLPAMETSSLQGQGLDTLLREIYGRLAERLQGDTIVASTVVRCRDSLRRAIEALDDAIQVNRDDAGEELVAAEVRQVLEELGQIVGTVVTDDILDRIFSRFCIGK
jgi:tRNA modification GTPase